MTTEQIVRVSIAFLIIAGYGAVLCIYMIWGPTEANKTLDALMVGLSTGYLLVLQSMFGGKS